jgi:hypothetical protein
MKGIILITRTRNKVPCSTLAPLWRLKLASYEAEYFDFCKICIPRESLTKIIIYYFGKKQISAAVTATLSDSTLRFIGIFTDLLQSF